MKSTIIKILSGGVLALCMSTPLSVWAQANLESPPTGGFVSGIGLIRGWRCEAPANGLIQIVIDDRRELDAPYGSDRGDTQDKCGDTDNGWGVTFNFNQIGAGEHTLTASADGEVFGTATFRVGRPSDLNYLRGAPGTYYILPDFPEDGAATAVRWEQVQQNFMIVEDGNTGVIPDSGTWMNTDPEDFDVCWHVSDDGQRLTSKGSLCENGTSLKLTATGRTDAGLECALAMATTADIPIKAGLFAYTIVDPVGLETVSSIVGRFLNATSARGAADATSVTVNSCTVDYTNNL